VGVTRKPISKKTRFEVFKRDSFTCQYCGRTPPAVVLELDHIQPVSKGGKNDIDNLLTACMDCNRGKADGLLSSVPQSVKDKAEILQEQNDQLKAYQRLIKSKQRGEDKMIDTVQEAFSTHFPGFSFAPKFRQSVRLFLQRMPYPEVVNAMHLACSRMGDKDRAISYFCGICWKTIKGGQ
jgi:hypothetical protein